jgi:hypothetical protein
MVGGSSTTRIIRAEVSPVRRPAISSPRNLPELSVHEHGMGSVDRKRKDLYLHRDLSKSGLWLSRIPSVRYGMD